MKSKFTLLFIFIFSFGFSQLSKSAEISVITTGSGDYLYEKFGHTAIRIIDKENYRDEIYNYGIFDLNQSNFYWNFTKGYMKYKLMKYPFYLSLRSANEEKRWVKEQVLNLTYDEKIKIFNFLETNVLPKNASYFYDPFFDNCATKPQNIILKTWDKNFKLVDNFSSNKSLRELMNEKINQNTWGSLGINIALGSKLDRKISALEYGYIPEYLSKILASSKINRNGNLENCVKKTQILLNFEPKKSKSDLVSPFLVFSLILLLIAFVTYKDYKIKKRSKWLDFSLFFATGIVGCILIFLWFFTNHSTAPNNFNLLWGQPFNILILIYLLKNNFPKWIKFHIRFLVVLLMIIPIIWLTEIQLFNWTLIPLFLGLFVRYFYLSFTKHDF